MNDAGEFLEGTKGPYRSPADYILGITHEIWESRQIEKIYDYYSPDTLIFTLGGLVRGSEAIVQNTRDTLAAFPDRLLLSDAVIWSREGPGAFYSSHRIVSPMTHLGDHVWSSATGRKVQVTTVADCVVKEGVIVREWLVRDNWALAMQMGLDPAAIARSQAKSEPAADFAAWLQAELSRVERGAPSGHPVAHDDWHGFADRALRNAWVVGDVACFEAHYAPYAVLHESQPVASGCAAIQRHFEALRACWQGASMCVDHVCARPTEPGAWDVAVRWGFVGIHSDEFLGVAATGAKFFVLGVTHWRIVAGRVAAEWTLFDKLALATQLLRPSNS